jgi:FkbM family methyltransferase
MSMNPLQKLHMVHRCWRLRFKSEVPSIHYVRTKLRPGTTVLDIGANKGVFSIYMSRAVGPRGKLIAFEAQPELGDHLRDVSKAFALDNMTVVNQGLSSAPGELTLYRPDVGSGMASFHAPAGVGHEEIKVPVIRLDDYLQENDVGPIHFIKCDVEDHELDVFRGGEHTLRQHMPDLLFECHDHEADRGELFDFLTGLGYEGFFFHVSRADHRSLLHKGRGKYVPFAERGSYPHVTPTVQHRNYVFTRNARVS